MKHFLIPKPVFWGYLFLLAGCEPDFSIQEKGNLVPKTVAEDVSLPSIIVNGAKLHAEAFGPAEGPLLVVLHGGPGADYRYLLNCRAFAEHGYRVVFYDQRGSGLSQRFDKNTYSLQVMEDELDGVIAHYRKHPDQKVFLLGHSWGAMLATGYINRYPDKTDGAILGEPGGLVWRDVRDYVKRAQGLNFFSERLSDAMYYDQILTGKENDHEILDYKFALKTGIEDKDSPIGNEGPLPNWRSGAVVSDALFEIGEEEGIDLTSRLDRYRIKVLFVYGERNKAYGRAHAQKVSAAYPLTELLEIPKAGHDMLSFPDGWNAFFPKGLAYLNALK